MLSAASEGSSSQTVPDAHTRQGRDVEERFVERERGSNGSALLINVAMTTPRVSRYYSCQ